jgi:hypothetical protein
MCKTQQILERLQEYGVDSFEVTEGVKGSQSAH